MRQCHRCGGKSQVIGTREGVDTIQRRRSCTVCGLEWHTSEVLFEQPYVDEQDIIRAAADIAARATKLEQRAHALLELLKQRAKRRAQKRRLVP